MQKYVEIIENAIRELFDANSSENFNVKISRTDAKFGDYSTNIAMILAGKLKRNPREIAEEITKKLRESSEFESVEIAGAGFINLKISAKNLAENLNKQFIQARENKRNFGENNDGWIYEIDEKSGEKIREKQKVAIVEYPSPNMAKPYSVGHLRSGNQGWAARNLLKASGWKVITDNHLGDSGSPFGFWVLGFKKFSNEEKLAKNGIYELGRVYIKIREELKKEEARGEKTLANEAQSWLLKLENQDPEAMKLSEKFNKISLDHIHEIMNRLGISTDYEIGEKFYVESGKSEVQKLLKENIATKNSDGSVIIDLTDEGIETPILVLKSNGAALYATTDLATMIYREENWHPEKVVYCVGSEQKFYFEQLAALAKKIGVKSELYHLWFGTIDQINEDGTRAKMSSRKGVVLMEELLNAALEKARENAKSDEMSEEDLRKISVGAIKFTDFASDRRTSMLFDWENMFSLTGFSGPYVQYAAVRINKILKDNSEENSENPNAENYDFANEKDLILKMLEYPEILRVAARELEPHRIANYIYELARELNRYYEKTPIATAEVSPEIKKIRLNFLRKIAAIFEHSLGILGIEIPDKM